jgi:hypothetical protein
VFLDRFEQRRIVTGHQFESIASGLALIGQSKHLDDWVVQPT